MLSTLLGLLIPTSANAAFVLVKEWVAPDEDHITRPYPSQRYPDGSRYLVEESGQTSNQIWRLQGASLTPMESFVAQGASLIVNSFFRRGDEVLLSVSINGVRSHWRASGTQLLPLVDEVGAIPFSSDWLWTSVGGEAVMSGVQSGIGRELWRLDNDGYELIKDVDSGPESSMEFGNPFRVWVGRVESGYVLNLNDGVSGTEPWVYLNGELTQLLDAVLGSGSSNARNVGSLGEFLYFGTNDNRLYKTDGETTTLLVDNVNVYDYPGRSWETFIFEDHLYAWWQPYGISNPGFILKISATDEVTRIQPTFGGPSDWLELISVAPFDGAVRIVAEAANGGIGAYTLQGNQVVASNLFGGWALKPEIKKHSDQELLFQDLAGPDLSRNVYCIKDGVTRAVWKGARDGQFGRVDITDSGDWIYITVLNSAAETEDAGAKSQLWAMPWPEGCDTAWVDEVIMVSGFEAVAN